MLHEIMNNLAGHDGRKRGAAKKLPKWRLNGESKEYAEKVEENAKMLRINYEKNSARYGGGEEGRTVGENRGEIVYRIARAIKAMTEIGRR